jgi:RNA polymerase sigma factor (sigma-70 family)
MHTPPPSPDAEARRLFASYRTFALKQTNHFHVDAESKRDLEQEALLALWQVACRYDATRGVDFSCYARPCVRGAIRRYLRDKQALIRVPSRRYDKGERMPCILESELNAMQTTQHQPCPDSDMSLGLDSYASGTAIGWREVIERAIASLPAPPQEQAILRCVMRDGHSQREAAGMLGVHRRDVRRAIARNIFELRRRIADLETVLAEL